jgi:acetyl-CoA C-acetyltransferase
MHAVGASGIMQVFEIATHIWNRGPKSTATRSGWQEFGRRKPDDWTDLQVQGASGVSPSATPAWWSHVTATILMDPESSAQRRRVREAHS